MITVAISRMALACNRNTLWSFRTDFSLEEGANEGGGQLPGLRKLWMVIEEDFVTLHGASEPIHQM